MTREELKSLGGDDRQLTRAYRRLGIEVDLQGPDDPEKQRVRGIAFDRVTTAAFLEGRVTPSTGKPASSFAIDDPELHRASALPGTLDELPDPG